jgi:hypothetical protein
MRPEIFADFSSAVPWLCMGFVAGLLAYALARAILGFDRRRIAELIVTKSRLDEVESTVAALVAEKATLDSDKAVLGSELARVSPRAAMVGQLEQEIARLRTLDNQRQSFLNTTAAQLASAREEIEVHRATAQYYEDEFGRLVAKHDKLQTSAYEQLTQLSNRLTEFEERLAAEAVHHRDEVAELRERAAAVPTEGIDPELYESEVAALVGTVKDLRAELAASEATVKESRTVLDHSCSLKDALPTGASSLHILHPDVMATLAPGTIFKADSISRQNSTAPAPTQHYSGPRPDVRATISPMSQRSP